MGDHAKLNKLIAQLAGPNESAAPAGFGGRLNFEAHILILSVASRTPRPRRRKRETAKPVGRARTEIFLFCTSSDPTWVNVIDLDGQRVRGLLRGRTVESRTLRRCRSLGREGECTGEIFATSAGPFSAASKSVATVFCAEKNQRILLASVFPYIPPIPVPLLPYSPASVLSSP